MAECRVSSHLIVPYISQAKVCYRFEEEELLGQHELHHTSKTGLSVESLVDGLHLNLSILVLPDKVTFTLRHQVE